MPNNSILEELKKQFKWLIYFGSVISFAYIVIVYYFAIKDEMWPKIAYVTTFMGLVIYYYKSNENYVKESTKSKSTIPVFADSLYYLGFMYTLLSIGAACVTLYLGLHDGDENPGDNQVATIIVQNGVALLTTIVGLFLRTKVGHFVVDPTIEYRTSVKNHNRGLRRFFGFGLPDDDSEDNPDSRRETSTDPGIAEVLRPHLQRFSSSIIKYTQIQRRLSHHLDVGNTNRANLKAAIRELNEGLQSLSRLSTDELNDEIYTVRQQLSRLSTTLRTTSRTLENKVADWSEHVDQEHEMAFSKTMQSYEPHATDFISELKEITKKLDCILYKASSTPNPEESPGDGHD